MEANSNDSDFQCYKCKKKCILHFTITIVIVMNERRRHFHVTIITGLLFIVLSTRVQHRRGTATRIRSPFIDTSPISYKVGHGRHGPGRDTPAPLTKKIAEARLHCCQQWEITDDDENLFAPCACDRSIGPANTCQLERAERAGACHPPALGYAFSITASRDEPVGDEAVLLPFPVLYSARAKRRARASVSLCERGV